MVRHEVIPQRRDDGALVYECTADGCGRLLVLDRGRLNVLRKGDPGALHGAGIGLSVGVG